MNVIATVTFVTHRRCVEVMGTIPTFGANLRVNGVSPAAATPRVAARRYD